VRKWIATCQPNRKRKYEDEREKDKNLPNLEQRFGERFDSFSDIFSKAYKKKPRPE
jgi:hypothetical protein